MAATLSAAGKKRLDEKNSKLVRELSCLLGNRNCSECGQRGPTYVNMTTCTFCCSTCSGIVRGLNPPHRIKSISMAVFTSEEVEKLRAGGNEEAAKTWLGMYTGPAERSFQTKEERTRFIVDKYEKKTWYVSAEEVERQRQLIDQAREARSEQLRTSTPKQQVDLFASDIFGSSSAPSGPPPSVSLDSVFAPPQPQHHHQQQQKLITGIPIPSDNRSRVHDPPFSPPNFMAPPPPAALAFAAAAAPFLSSNAFSFSPPKQTATPSFPAFSPPLSREPVLNAFVQIGNVVHTKNIGRKYTVRRKNANGVLRGASTANGSKIPSSIDNIFADFDEKFGAPPSIMTSSSSTIQQTAPSQPTGGGLLLQTADPFGLPISSCSQPPQPTVPPVPSTTTVSQERQGGGVLGAFEQQQQQQQNKIPVMPIHDADKYSALAELDELFHTTTVSDTKDSHKPAWVPSGFSAPAPVSSGLFNGGVTSNGVGGVSKSSTLGALSVAAGGQSVPNTFHTSTATAAFGNMPINPSSAAHQPPHSFSQMNLVSNPFYTPSSTPGGYSGVQALVGGASGVGGASFGGGAIAPQQQAYYAGTAASSSSQPHQPTMVNPFGAAPTMYTQPPGGAFPSGGSIAHSTPATNNANPFWNPFLT